MTRLLERTFLFGLGLLTLTREKVVQFVDKLVEEGEVRAEEAPKIVERIIARGEEEREALRKLVRQELERWVPASRQEVEELRKKVDELTRRLEEASRVLTPKPEEEG